MEGVGVCRGDGKRDRCRGVVGELHARHQKVGGGALGMDGGVKRRCPNKGQGRGTHAVGNNGRHGPSMP